MIHVIEFINGKALSYLTSVYHTKPHEQATVHKFMFLCLIFDFLCLTSFKRVLLLYHKAQPFLLIYLSIIDNTIIYSIISGQNLSVYSMVQKKR